VPILFPSVIWHCWLGDRKGIRPVKSWVLVCWWWQFYWSFAYMDWAVDATSLIVTSDGSCSVKIVRSWIDTSDRRWNIGRSRAYIIAPVVTTTSIILSINKTGKPRSTWEKWPLKWRENRGLARAKWILYYLVPLLCSHLGCLLFVWRSVLDWVPVGFLVSVISDKRQKRKVYNDV